MPGDQFISLHHDFHPESLLLSLQTLLGNCSNKVVTLSNRYPEVVKQNGNAAAKAIINKAFTIVDAHWRGIGVIPGSGFSFASRLSHLDATNDYAPVDFPSQCAQNVPETTSPCEKVILGKMAPDACPFFGQECKPASPKGACMVSDEGACRIWYSSGERSITNVIKKGNTLKVEMK